jgi:hypothetical protein
MRDRGLYSSALLCLGRRKRRSERAAERGITALTLIPSLSYTLLTILL